MQLFQVSSLLPRVVKITNCYVLSIDQIRFANNNDKYYNLSIKEKQKLASP
jgi:hypothetical protein